MCILFRPMPITCLSAMAMFDNVLAVTVLQNAPNPEQDAERDQARG